MAHKILHYNHTPLLSFKCTSPTHKSIFLHFYKREQKEDWIHMAENNWFHLLENTWTCKGSQAISVTITVAFRLQHTNTSPERLMKGTLQLPSWDWVRQAGQETRTHPVNEPPRQFWLRAWESPLGCVTGKSRNSGFVCGLTSTTRFWRFPFL